jgi:aspartate racemase
MSIVNTTCKHVSNLTIKKIGLLGTKFTMTSDFYAKKLDEYGVQTIVPNSADIEYIQHKLMTEIELGIIKEKPKQPFYNNLVTSSAIDGLILGCTELPLIIKQSDIKIHYIDTAKIHIENIVVFCRN